MTTTREVDPRMEAGQRYCMHCGAELLTRAAFCTSCGKAVGAAPQKPPAEHETTGLATYGDRVAAWLIDSAIVYGVAVIVLTVIIAIYLPDAADSEPGQTGLGFVLVPIVPLYSALLQGLWHGQTIGKRCLGIAVRSLDGAEIRLGRSFGRSYVRAATWLFFPAWILDSLWPLREERRRALHDLAAGTIVITRRTGAV